jgi:hypothetical protein
MKSQMQNKLIQILEKAETCPGRYQNFRTTNNLKVDIMVHGKQTYLQISRSSAFPTLGHWASISRHWPYPLRVIPKKVVRYGRYYLAACWTADSEKTPVFAFPPKR